MPCLSSADIAAIKAEILELDALIILIKAAYTESITGSPVQEYRFDSGDGSQKTIRRAPREIKQELDEAKSERNRLAKQLTGGSNVIMRTNRRGNCGSFRY